MALKNIKTGIVTFFYAKNYGGVLQAYALQRFLSDNGVKSEFVNYIPDEDLSLGQRIRKYIKSIVRNPSKDSFAAVFDRFKSENLTLGRRIRKFNDLKRTEYDLLIASSDQIWNTNLNKSSTAFFLLEFAPSSSSRTSYASCTGQTEQSEKYTGLFASALPKFSHISVRNDFSKDLLIRYAKDITICCDPTLLIDFSEFNTDTGVRFDNYILVYSLNANLSELLNSSLSRLKEICDLPVVVIHSKFRLTPDIHDQVIENCTPQQWVSIFRNASFVLTDSFHGVIFALKFRKDFIAIHGNDWRSHRLTDICRRYSCGNACITDASEITPESIKTDHDSVEIALKAHIKNSSDYLMNILREVSE